MTEFWFNKFNTIGQRMSIVVLKEKEKQQKALFVNKH